MKITKYLFLLSLIIFLSFLFRLFRIDQIRLTHDEMSIGYNAYSILKTAKDEWGRFLPLDFEAFGDHKLPLYIYTAVPFVYLFGLSELSVKMPSILAGVILVALIYFLTKKLLKNRNTALLSAALIAFSPATIQLSRSGLEANLALSLFTAAILTTLFYLKDKRSSIHLSILSGILFALTFYTYIAYRLLIFFIFGIIILLADSRKKIKLSLISLLTCLVFILPILPQMLGNSGTARFSQVGILNNPGIVDGINDRRSFCYLTGPKYLPKICKFIYNKPIAYSEIFIKSYLQTLSPEFLFFKGDSHIYLNNPDFAEFYIILLPFYLLGIYTAFKNRDLASKLILSIFFIAPIPAALVGEAQIVRASILILPATYLSSLGITQAFSLIKNKILFKKIFSLSLTAIFIFLTTSYLINTYYVYPQKYDENFYRLAKELVFEVEKIKNNYDLIYVSDKFADAHILFSFYGQYDPSWYQENILRKDEDSFGFSHAQTLGKIEFGSESPEALLCQTDKKILYISENRKESGGLLKEFKSFSGVHVQAELIDTSFWRHELESQGKLETSCP
ncbi:MAG: glycosyltransferase family 39 protein [Patescibacteria group bacterium]